MLISSSANPRFGFLKSLQKRRHRDAARVFWVEGEREVLRALQAGWSLSMLIVRERAELPAGISADQVIELVDRLWSQVVYRDSTEELAGVFAYPGEMGHQEELERLLRSGAGVVVLDGVEKPGNVGAILRSVDATGGLVVLATQDLDWFNPNLIRASLGACFSLRCMSIGWGNLMPLVADRRIVILDPEADKEWSPGSIAGSDILVLGAEATGLSSEALQVASARIRLPMKGMVDSLNVAQCATVLLYDRLTGSADT